MRKSDDFAQAFDFFGGDAAAEFGDAVIAPALVVQVRMGPLPAFFDGALVEEFLDRAVEGARARIQGCVCAAADFPQDGVAVTLAVGQGHENMQKQRGQRKEFAILVIGTAAWHDNHPV